MGRLLYLISYMYLIYLTAVFNSSFEMIVIKEARRGPSGQRFWLERLVTSSPASTVIA